jgi:hypothetical protein
MSGESNFSGISRIIAFRKVERGHPLTAQAKMRDHIGGNQKNLRPPEGALDRETDKKTQRRLSELHLTSEQANAGKLCCCSGARE